MCPWSGSGSFARSDGTRSGPTVFAQQEAAGVAILSTLMDLEAQDMADAINNCLAKDGQNAATADISMGGNQIISLGDAATLTDAINARQVQKNSVCYGGTAGGTANALTLACTPAMTAYTAGQVVWFKAAAINTAGTEVNINSVGNVNLWTLNGQSMPYGTFQVGGLYGIIYSGTEWRLFSRGSVPYGINGWTPTYTGQGTLNVTGLSTLFRLWHRDPDTNLVTFSLEATGTVTGTGTGYYFTLPANAAQGNVALVGSWYDSGVRYTGQAYILDATHGVVVNADSSNFIHAGVAGFSCSGQYPAVA